MPATVKCQETGREYEIPTSKVTVVQIEYDNGKLEFNYRYACTEHLRALGHTVTEVVSNITERAARQIIDCGAQTQTIDVSLDPVTPGLDPLTQRVMDNELRVLKAVGFEALLDYQ